jgi:hypothetical protein
MNALVDVSEVLRAKRPAKITPIAAGTIRR